MKGVNIIYDETNNKRFVQIDLKRLEKDQESVEDLLDAIIAESRKGDETISLDDLVEELKADGKL
tara:strand:- start:423 stop:617 length:195 start_codon:yes stop_codon:yes gene_type:complete